MPRRASAPRTRVLGLLGGALSVLVIAGCLSSPDASPPPASPSPTTTAGSPSPAPGPDAPVLVPDGSAADNLPLFAAVTADVWGTADKARGRAYIDALVEAGFDKSAMQVTRDETTVGNPVESMQFSVRWGEDECLIGQVGPSTGAPVTVVAAQLAEGRCLVGETREIDW